MFQIDNDIPMPAGVGRNAAIYPFRTMKVGDSFFVPCSPDKAVSRASSMSSNARAKGIKVTTSRLDGGVRVWRVA